MTAAAKPKTKKSATMTIRFERDGEADMGHYLCSIRYRNCQKGDYNPQPAADDIHEVVHAMFGILQRNGIDKEDITIQFTKKL